MSTSLIKVARAPFKGQLYLPPLSSARNETEAEKACKMDKKENESPVTELCSLALEARQEATVVLFEA